MRLAVTGVPGSLLVGVALLAPTIAVGQTTPPALGAFAIVGTPTPR
jgi:hypothetical protein